MGELARRRRLERLEEQATGRGLGEPSPEAVDRAIARFKEDYPFSIRLVEDYILKTAYRERGVAEVEEYTDQEIEAYNLLNEYTLEEMQLERQ